MPSLRTRLTEIQVIKSVPIPIPLGLCSSHRRSRKNSVSPSFFSAKSTKYIDQGGRDWGGLNRMALLLLEIREVCHSLWPVGCDRMGEQFEVSIERVVKNWTRVSEDPVENDFGHSGDEQGWHTCTVR